MSECKKNLLFSFETEISTPSSCVGKVWRVHIKSGTLNVGDFIKITSVKIVNSPKSDFYDVIAVIKSIHRELDTLIEGKQETDFAHKGDIVGIDVKNCYCGREKIRKKDINITKHSVGFHGNEQLSYHHNLYIQFAETEKAFELIKEQQQIALLWFGKVVQGEVVKISEALDGMYVNLLYDIKLAVPENPIFKNSDVIKKIVLRIESKGKFRYTTGFFDFDATF